MRPRVFCAPGRCAAARAVGVLPHPSRTHGFRSPQHNKRTRCSYPRHLTAYHTAGSQCPPIGVTSVVADGDTHALTAEAAVVVRPSPKQCPGEQRHRDLWGCLDSLSAGLRLRVHFSR